MRHGPNIISCLLVSGRKATPIIGAYLPPSHLNDLPDLQLALDRFRSTSRAPLLLGDLNIDLYDNTSNRTSQVANLLATYGLEDLLRHFKQRKRHCLFHTWWQLALHVASGAAIVQ